jgi:hypothetical protein
MGFRFMKIRILKSAREDLIEGFHFYELQREGLGSYFLESLFSDIESLKLFAGSIAFIFKIITGFFQKDSLSQFIIEL